MDSLTLQVLDAIQGKLPSPACPIQQGSWISSMVVVWVLVGVVYSLHASSRLSFPPARIKDKDFEKRTSFVG